MNILENRNIYIVIEVFVYTMVKYKQTEDRSVVELNKSFYVSLPLLWSRYHKIKKGSKLLLNVYVDRIVIRTKTRRHKEK